MATTPFPHLGRGLPIIESLEPSLRSPLERRRHRSIEHDDDGISRLRRVERHMTQNAERLLCSDGFGLNDEWCEDDGRSDPTDTAHDASRVW